MPLKFRVDWVQNIGVENEQSKNLLNLPRTFLHFLPWSPKKHTWAKNVFSCKVRHATDISSTESFFVSPLLWAAQAFKLECDKMKKIRTFCCGVGVTKPAITFFLSFVSLEICSDCAEHTYKHIVQVWEHCSFTNGRYSVSKWKNKNNPPFFVHLPLFRPKHLKWTKTFFHWKEQLIPNISYVETFF